VKLRYMWTTEYGGPNRDAPNVYTITYRGCYVTHRFPDRTSRAQIATVLWFARKRVRQLALEAELQGLVKIATNITLTPKTA
jgi:hypothetical protein